MSEILRGGPPEQRWDKKSSADVMLDLMKARFQNSPLLLKS